MEWVRLVRFGLLGDANLEPWAILLVRGLLSSLACFLLLVNMLVAILTTKLSGDIKALSPLNWVDDFLYFPEVLYVLFFVWLFCSGPGTFSLDRLMATRFFP